MQYQVRRQATPEFIARRNMKISGWQRIGVVASIIWFFAGGFIGNNLAIDNADTRTSLWFNSCVAANKRQFGEYGPYEQVWTPCWNQFSSQHSKNWEESGHWLVALAFALIPLPIAWLLGWLIISTTRWVARGFGAE
jgi:hypothetical protein